MKTKFILTAMCLPLAFAACTNEDVLVENQNALEGKKVVDFKVSATYGAEGAESRMVNNNGTFLWEGTDVLGAAWNKSGDIYSNNKFVNTLTEASATADFTTQATTVEGKYVFYYPYSTDVTKNLAGGIAYTLPEPQEYDPTGEKMMNNNFMISPNIIVDGNEPGELTLPLTMRSIYAYGQLNLTLPEVLVIDGANVNSVNIQKIIIDVKTSNTFKNGKIAVDKLPVVDLTAENIETLIAGESGNADLDEACEGKTEAEVRAILFAAADKDLTAQSNVYKEGTVKTYTAAGTQGGLNQVSITCVSEENPDGIELTKNGTFSTRVLLPTTNGSIVEIKVYTDQGVWTKTLTDQKIKANHTANLANLNREPSGASSFKMASFKKETGTINTISEADFIASVKILKANASVAVGDFSLTPAAVAAIPADVAINFTTDVTFEGDMTLKNMAFTKANLKSGKIELAENLNAPELNIEGAEATIKANGTYGVINVNGGSLEVAAVNEDGEAVAVVATSVIVSEPDVNGESVAASLLVTNELNANVDVFSKGTLVNNATISSLTVRAETEATNNGVVEIMDNLGFVYNAGTIEDCSNYGEIQMQTGGVILESENEGKIYTVAGSEVTTEQVDGEVIYTVGARVAATGGHVTYIAGEGYTFSNLKTLNDCVTKVLFEKDVTVSADFKLDGNHKSAKTFEFKGNLTVSGAKKLELLSGTEFIFTGTEQIVTVDKEIKNLSKLTVGVDDDTTTEDVNESIPTNLTITKNSVIGDISEVFIAKNAQVWNEGKLTNVTGGATKTGEGVWKYTQLTWK